MPVNPLKTKKEDATLLIEQEIAMADNERRAISRQMLAELVHTRTGIPVNDAFAIVEEYCEERAPGVPGYLQEEFAIPYLKVVAVINVLVGMGAFWWGITAFQRSKPIWPWMCVGTIFVGLGALAWVKSVERYVERKAKRQAKI